LEYKAYTDPLFKARYGSTFFAQAVRGPSLSSILSLFIKNVVNKDARDEKNVEGSCGWASSDVQEERAAPSARVSGKITRKAPGHQEKQDSGAFPAALGALSLVNLVLNLLVPR
jgi:hypothetical protein